MTTDRRARRPHVRLLGRADTLELCRPGAAVVADDLDEAALKEVADAARDLPGSVHAVVCDVTGPDAPRTLLDAALRRYGQLHGLVSNAGRALFSGRSWQLSISRQHESQVNPLALACW